MHVNLLVVYIDADPAVRKACYEMRRCMAIIDLMAMNTLYGVMAFSEADFLEACRLDI